jgi:hypothetical protein
MDVDRLRLLIRESLESVRTTVTQRLRDSDWPTSLPTTVPVVELGPAGLHKTNLESRQMASVNSHEIAKSISPEGIPWDLGIADKLLTLAQFLDETTDLANRKEIAPTTLPITTPQDMIIKTYLEPMSRRYLYSLADLACPDDRAIDDLTKEFEDVITDPLPRHRFQIHLSGLLVNETIRDGNVTLRPLTKSELGFLSELLYPNPTQAVMLERDLLLPFSLKMSLPTCLIEVELAVDRPFQDGFGDADILHRFVLACSLCGINVGGTGLMMASRYPRWIGLGGTLSMPSPVFGRFVSNPVEMDQVYFAELMKLARRMPILSESSNTQGAIALYRALRGFMAPFGEGDGFLDFAVALEAALLSKENSELSFKFALYGAALLRRTQLPEETFAKLRKVYQMRSKLVHGIKYSVSERAEAGSLAKELCQNVLLEVLDVGWPDENEIRRLMLESMNGGLAEDR